MKQLIKRDVETWVNVAEEMPYGNDWIHTNLGLNWLDRDGGFYDTKLLITEVFPTSWLKVVHDVYVLTEEDLSKVLKSYMPLEQEKFNQLKTPF